MTLTRINTTINTKVTATKVNTSVYRFGYRWNVNECLRLQREYELLKLSVPEIAALHGRTIKAIIYKISAEGFASFNDLFVQTYGVYSEQVLDEQDLDDQEQVLDEQVLDDQVLDDQVLELDPAFESDSTDSELDLDDLNLDEDYVPDVHSDSTDSDNDYEDEDEDEDEDEGSNKHYLYSQVKSMQKQISAILGYLTKGATTSASSAALDSYGGV